MNKGVIKVNDGIKLSIMEKLMNSGVAIRFCSHHELMNHKATHLFIYNDLYYPLMGVYNFVVTFFCIYRILKTVKTTTNISFYCNKQTFKHFTIIDSYVTRAVAIS